MSKEAAMGWAVRYLLAAVGCLGIAQAAFLPPFEGFDETAHYSSIQQIADQGRIPQPSIDKLSSDVESYPGPLPLDASGNAGSDRSYLAFFSRGNAGLPQSVDRAYRAGTTLNWEAQHPPLYYLLMVPLYRLARHWTWQSNFLLLRLASWGLAFAGFAIGGLANFRLLAGMGAGGAALLVAGWPLLFPEFFPEMARLGNDSLCIFIMGMAWSAVLQLLKAPNPRVSVWLGLLLGVGLLTKAIFLPIGAGVAVLLTFAAWRRPENGRIADVCRTACLAIVLGGGWYVHELLVTGTLTGVNILAAAERQGGVWSLLSTQLGVAPLLHMLRGAAVMAASFVWVGTWSRATLPPLLAAPVLLLAVWPMLLWLKRIQHGPIEAAAPVFVIFPVVAGLMYQNIAINLITEAGAGTGGWYLHVLAAPLSLALALGWRHRRIFCFLTIYALLFHAACWATQLSFFSGCAYKPGARESLRLDPGSCLILPSHLAALGEPILGGAALLAAAILGGAALLAVIGRDRRAEGLSSPTGSR